MKQRRFSICRSPIAIIDEFYLKKKLPPPLYTFYCENSCTKKCSVVYRGQIVIGRGRSKIKAKREAAFNLIDHLLFNVESIRLEPPFFGERLIDVSDEPKKMCALQINNYIGQLYEFCVKNGLNPPEFHIRRLSTSLDWFLGTCKTIGFGENRPRFEAEEIGFSQRKAKQNVARSMLETMRNEKSQYEADKITISSLMSTDPPSTNEDFSKYYEQNKTELLQLPFVESLENYCEKEGLPPPTYERINWPTDGTVYVKCTVGHLEMLGNGPADPEAMMSAAAILLLKLVIAKYLSGDSNLTGASAIELLTKKRKKRRTALEKSKNFTGDLLEFCTKRQLDGERPVFEEIEHVRNERGHSEFYIKCSFNGVDHLGRGRSKIEARRAAAKLALEAIPKRKRAEKSSPLENYVQLLFEYCLKEKMPSASFEEVLPRNAAGQIEYMRNEKGKILHQFQCKVNGTEYMGMGTTKKQAKRAAAKLALNVLQPPVSSPPSDVIASNDDEPSTSSNQAVENETMEILEENVLPSSADPDHIQQSIQQRDADNETMEIVEENVLPSSADPDHIQQSIQQQDADNETMEIGEKNVLVLPDDSAGTDHNQQSIQSNGKQVAEDENMEIAEEDDLRHDTVD